MLAMMLVSANGGSALTLSNRMDFLVRTTRSANRVSVWRKVAPTTVTGKDHAVMVSAIANRDMPVPTVVKSSRAPRTAPVMESATKAHVSVPDITQDLTAQTRSVARTANVLDMASAATKYASAIQALVALIAPQRLGALTVAAMVPVCSVSASVRLASTALAASLSWSVPSTKV